MNPWAHVVIGLMFGMMGMGYLYRPRAVARVIAFLRDYALNDAHLSLERRKWGLFFLLLSFLFLYVGYSGLAPAP